MEKRNIWILLAVIYVLVIASIVVYRMKKQAVSTQTVTETVTTPVTSTSTTPTQVMEQMYVEFKQTETTASTKQVDLQLVDAMTFESAGYTLDLEYDPAVIKITDVTPGDIWDESIVLQKEISTPGKVVYSIGRGMKSISTGGNVLATLKIQVVDKNATTTQISLSQTSRSAGNTQVKSIIAEPITVTLK